MDCSYLSAGGVTCLYSICLSTYFCQQGSAETATVTVTVDGIPDLARSMGQDTIDMLSKAKMR
jgi:uncharacterized protein YabE (DUF348 family)